MGLAGRKHKQRIPTDPRNLTWADDASRFGLAYLSKFGWDASKGLGSSGDGMKTHLKVQQKLDMMGIGAQHQRDPNGIAWKQSKDFEALLKRLNEGSVQGNGEAEEVDKRAHETVMDNAFVRAQEDIEEEPSVTRKKRKHGDNDNLDANENTGEKQKEKKKRPKYSPDTGEHASPATDPSSSSPSTEQSEPILKSRPMAHRARIRAAKRLAGKSPSAIAEILGIVPFSSVSSSTSCAPTPPTSISTNPAHKPSTSLENLTTTSTKSVADYFKEKLLARSSSSSSPTSSSTPSGSAVFDLGAAKLAPDSPDDDGELPRRGISSRSPTVPPPLQIPEGGSAFIEDADVTQKLGRKAERKAEKRRQREAGAIEALGNGKNTQKTSKQETKRRERKALSSVDRPNDNDDDDNEKIPEDNTPSGLESKKKSKKGRSS